MTKVCHAGPKELKANGQMLENLIFIHNFCLKCKISIKLGREGQKEKIK